MDKRRVTPRFCFLLTAGLTLVGVVLRTICLLFCFEPDPGYFTAGILPTASNVLYVAAVILPAVCVLLTPSAAYPRELRTPLRSIPAIGLGVGLAAFAVASFLLCFPARTSNIMLAPLFLGAASSFYYLLTHNRNGIYSDGRALLGYLPVLWSIAAVGDVYFDRYVTMNSPVKISLQLGFLGFMLIGLAELRFRIGRPLPRYAASFWAIGAYACLTGALPILIATGVGILDDRSHLLYAAVLLLAGIYGLYLLFCHTALPTAPATPAETNTSA